jgi:hypothetical protein
MTQTSCTITIDVSVDLVWQLISNFGAACQYLVGVVSCTVAGEGIGARRMLISVDGTTIVERLETLSEPDRRLSYALLTDTPFRNCLATMTVRDLSPNMAELEWSTSFEADGLPADEAREMLESALTANCLAVKQFIESGRK